MLAQDLVSLSLRTPPSCAEHLFQPSGLRLLSFPPITVRSLALMQCFAFNKDKRGHIRCIERREKGEIFGENR